VPEASLHFDDATKLLLAHQLVDCVRARIERKLARATNLTEEKEKVRGGKLGRIKRSRRESNDREAKREGKCLHSSVAYSYFGVSVDRSHDALVSRLRKTTV
jgi:hypothetical protein